MIGEIGCSWPLLDDVAVSAVSAARMAATACDRLTLGQAASPKIVHITPSEPSLILIALC